MHLERQPGLLACPLDQPIEAFPIERCAALVDEDEGRLRVLLLLQFPQRSQLGTADLVRGRLTVLLAADVHRSSPEVDRIPGQLAQLGSPQTMPIGDQDHGRATMTVAITFGGLDQPLDLGLGQVLPLPVVGIRPTSLDNCHLLSVNPPLSQMQPCEEQD